MVEKKNQKGQCQRNQEKVKKGKGVKMEENREENIKYLGHF